MSTRAISSHWHVFYDNLLCSPFYTKASAGWFNCVTLIFPVTLISCNSAFVFVVLLRCFLKTAMTFQTIYCCKCLTCLPTFMGRQILACSWRVACLRHTCITFWTAVDISWSTIYSVWHWMHEHEQKHAIGDVDFWRNLARRVGL